MRTIYITDLIGSYCGMHYYDEAFAELLRENGYRVQILSTFGEKGGRQFFPLIFKKNKIVAVFFLFGCYVKLFCHMISHRKAIYIYMCYGEFYDLLMLSLAIWSKYMFCDVHEVHALKYTDDSLISRFFNWYYTKFVRFFIYHSNRTKNILSGLKINVPMLYLPHLEYTFKKEYDIALLSEDIAQSFISDKVKFLFFGNLSKVKGVDVIVDTFMTLPTVLKAKSELVVAGKNVDSIDFETLRTISSDFRVFDRHINDDELVYLYSHTDFVLLPYRKSSQSGIFAMASYFHKPMLLTDIPYFHNMLQEFPSFGKIIEIEKYKSMIEEVIIEPKLDEYYNTLDCDKSSQKVDVNKFFMKFFRLVN